VNVTDVGTNRKPVCHFLLVINTDHFEVIADYCLNLDILRFGLPFGLLWQYTLFILGSLKARSGLPSHAN